MRRIVLLLCLILVLTLSGCAAPQAASPDGLVIVATTRPVYDLATAVTDGIEGLTLRLMLSEPVSCLHDYTLTTADMKLLESADVLLLSGAGLEEFLDEVLGYSDAQAVDCSAGVELLLSDHTHEESHTHDDGHDHEIDPHIWLDPRRAAVMVQNMADALSALDPDHAETYAANAAAAVDELILMYGDAYTHLKYRGLTCRELIVFHDGFAYLADALGLTVLRSIEIEDGAAPSARELADVIQLIQERGLPAIFTEVNGSHAAAQTIGRETGAQVYELSMMLSPPDSGAEGLAAYRELFFYNVTTLRKALP